MPINPLEYRKADHPIDEQFLRRWSPRAMSGESLTDAEIKILFEAARWAPSAYNEQPWVFLYAKRDTPHWDSFFNLLIPFNQGWAKDAAMLVVVTARMNLKKNATPNAAHLFDTGAAWENLALQASKMGLVAHGMTGIKLDEVKPTLKIPADHAVAAMIAIGRPGDPATLPDGLRERELPNDRLPLSEIIREGGY
ncbi:Nitroreductase [Arboricoccus pini]|uniref:Nitroreductase n=1 Tax=Arboricoccus pini TaxID=1963835 RepID=A0A212QRL0_9PROT|nr:nitroreductase family protein [Arboricoccus pini]SNB62215.1 Nitroreductase [Arboricoccus pini]